MILFIGFKKVNNVTQEKKEIDKSVKTVVAFNNIDESNKLIYGSEYRSDDTNEMQKAEINIDNFFLKTLINSNAYMRVVLMRNFNLEGNLSISGYIFKSIFNSFEPQLYLKSQLPAIISIVETTQVSSTKVTSVEPIDEENNIEEKDKDNKEKESKVEEDNVPILDDILYIEDPYESEEGEQMQGNDNEDLDVLEMKIPDEIKLNKKPYILIYHTHGTEAYLPIKENNYHTTKRKYNVLTIGEIVTDILAKNGHKIKHIDIYHDIPSYSESYYRSLATVQETMKKEKEINIVFDIHRDGVPENASYLEKAKEQSKVEISGKNVATFSIVIGPENPNKEKIIKFAELIKGVSDKLYPGLCKGIIIKPYGKFNQFVCNHYALIEIGSNLNTIEEAKESAKLIADVLDKVIKVISSTQDEN
ncbi:Stage II sporulation protein P [Caldisalinibacter kiritimatiensis]|uniref:Stage II sporulation protein P n=1 Tax=Caldisalinibacter kiritimatiensis TaxID=1304284 RepID=R1AUQ0_9FIRM|nr:Stage II sporulation protein P [Caldisalinibacter kiritimatiensis]